jgi:CheY-like chemotaxis protein
MNGHALIIEDDVAVQNLFMAILNIFQLAPIVAGTGAEGLFYYLRNPEAYRIVMLDLLMPEVTGDDVMRVLDTLIDRNLIRPRQHFIVTTAGHNMAHLKRIASKPYVRAVCQKPIDQKEIGYHIDTIIRSGI